MLIDDGYDLVERLMEGLMVAAFLVVASLVSVHSAIAISTNSASRDQARFAAMRQDLNNLAAQQALYYADERSYSSSMSDLRFDASDGVTISIEASKSGWSATAMHSALGKDEGCAVYFGTMARPQNPIVPSRRGETACTD